MLAKERVLVCLEMTECIRAKLLLGNRKPCTAATNRASSTRQKRLGEDVAIVVVVFLL